MVCCIQNQKKYEKAEYPGSAPREFCKSRKMPKEYFFFRPLDRSLQQQRKKRHINHCCYVQCQSVRKAKKWGWVTQPDRAQKILLRNCAWLFQNYHSFLNYCMILTFFTTRISLTTYLGGNWYTQDLYVIKWKQTKAQSVGWIKWWGSLKTCREKKHLPIDLISGNVGAAALGGSWGYRRAL